MGSKVGLFCVSGGFRQRGYCRLDCGLHLLSGVQRGYRDVWDVHRH